MTKKILIITILSFLFILILNDTVMVEAGTGNTLRDLKAELELLKNSKTASDAQSQSTQEQINANNQEIAEAYTKIQEAEDNIEISQKKIEDSNIKIAELSEIAGELMIVYEKLQNQDTYLSFVTAANTLAELIMRVDAINQLLKYNEDTINELEYLIVENEKEQVYLLQVQKDLEDSVTAYKAKIESLQADLQYFAQITEDIDDQIKNQETLIDYYEKLGCTIDQNLDDCVDIANNVTWLKPLEYAYVTSEFGYRYIWGSYSFHNGIDLGGNAEGTPIYASVAGTVAAITVKSSCGGNKVYVHSYVDGEPYTTAYLHLLSINVSVGDQISTSTKIGTVGGGSQTSSYDFCSTGAHLHFTVATGFYLGGTSGSYSSYSTYVANSINPPGYPGLYGTFYSRTAWFS